MKIYLRNSKTNYKFVGVVCHGLSYYTGDNMSGSRITQLVEYSPCKQWVLGLSLTAYFSQPLTFFFIVYCLVDF